VKQGSIELIIYLLIQSIKHGLVASVIYLTIVGFFINQEWLVIIALLIRVERFQTASEILTRACARAECASIDTLA